MSKKSPQLRFEGFTDDWEERKLGEIFNYEQPTKYIVKSTEYDDNFNTPVLTAGKSFLLGYTDEISGIKNATVENPVVIFDDFTTGSHYVDFPFKIKSSAMKLLSLNDNSDNFYFMFNTLKNIKYVPQSHERHWISKFSSFEIYKPSQEEQQKIGSFFKHLDDTIALHQRKLDLLKEQKKGYLQKMFPKNGAKVPELRFAGFADDWEDRKLGEISKYSNGGSYENDVVENGTYELITLKSVNMSGKLVSSGKFINRETKTLEKDTLVMILSEQAPGLLGMTAQIPENNKYVLNQRVAEIKPNTNIDSYFLSMSINRSQVYFSKRGAGTKVQNISKPNVENFEFYCPSEREQQKIGSFFKQVDNTIDLHQHKLDLLKEQKKGFLQKMFV